MSSYYNRVEGTLKTGKTARADDIHLIQSSIETAIENIIIDMFGTGFILGESENALKLYGTDKHTDQVNYNYNENSYFMSFYDRYIKQLITIKKSSIETIRVYMANYSQITTTVYAEIRDKNLRLIQEANATLAPTPLNSEDDTKFNIEFHFNKKHLPIGDYYFIIRPVDISSTDLTLSGDGVPYQEITEDSFLIKYDADGNYNRGLQVSYDGATYLDARELPELTVTMPGDTISENNPDLFFEEVFSSGITYVIDNKFSAVILGEKVYPLDTHVTISEPSEKGNRTDLVSLTKDGQLVVTEGTVYTNKEEKIYPVNPIGLNVAYITNFKASEKKVPAIEQDDDNNITRHRDILERLRRLEKKMNYQIDNNSPTRIKYICNIDPILINNGVDDNAEIRGEGTYQVSTSTNEDGEPIVIDRTALNYAWSIIKDNYTYNINTDTNENGQITVYDTYTTSVRTNSYNTNKKGFYTHYIEVIDNSTSTPRPVPNLNLKVQVKKDSDVKKSYDVTTNNNGIVHITFFSLKLSPGTYSIYTIYGEQKIKSKLVVVGTESELNGKTAQSHTLDLSLPVTDDATITQKLPNGVIPGNDSFYADNVDVDVDNGEVRIRKISNISDEYEINEGRSLLKNLQEYKSSERIYLINDALSQEITSFPALHVTFDREVYIKSITPYIEGFRNIESFGILIFKNDAIHNIEASRQTYRKNIGSGEVNSNSYDDDTFPTLYKSKYVSLKDLVKKSGNYQILNEQVTFDDINLNLDMGTYTIMICPKLEANQNEGEIKIKHYNTKNDAIQYGTSENVYGSSQLSTVYINSMDVHDTSWDIAIKHKTYQYYDSGTLISKPIDTGVTFSACTIYKNFIIPKNCDIKLYVSNNGGSSWILANTNHVTFNSSNSSFRWKLEMKSNNIATPKLKFNNKKQSAISFNLATSISYVSYEDYQQCYETPIMNANAISKTYTRSAINNAFQQWEFARVFMEDEELNSKIDILISYADDNTTTTTTNKKEWGKNIFFSTVFADLTLDDFNQESVDYDNYEGNVEYDEHNYKFDFNSEEVVNVPGKTAVAAPDVWFNNIRADYQYGDINETPMTEFSYRYIDSIESPYEYKDNSTDSKKRYSGMRIINGPYMRAAYSPKNNTYTSNDTIVGVRFNNGLEIDETRTIITIGLKAGNINESENTDFDAEKYFPAGTFKVILSLGQYGELDTLTQDITVHNNETHEDSSITNQIYNTGKSYKIQKKIYFNQYTEVSIDISEDIDGFKSSGINSIAIKAVEPNTAMSEGDFIGLGRITTSSTNIRPYVEYMYSGSWNRLKWKKLIDNKYCQAYAMYTLGRETSNNTFSSSKIFYPIDYDAEIESRTIISAPDINEEGIPIIGQSKLKTWGTETNKDGDIIGTSRKILNDEHTYSNNNYYIERNENQITTHWGMKNNQPLTYITEDSGNEILLVLPKETTGDIFKIDTNIPYTIYDLIDIEYYVFCRYWESNNEDKPENMDKEDYWNVHKASDGNVYETDGSFAKGEVYIDLYDTREIDKAEPIESFALPSWGRIATRSEEKNKVVHALFKKRKDAGIIKSIVVRRENPRQYAKEDIRQIKLMLNNILFLNATNLPALGPQMQMRIYPNNIDNLTNTKIRKVGGVYRL